MPKLDAARGSLPKMEGFDPAADLARIDAVENPALKARALELLRQREDMGDSVFGKAMQYMLLGEHEAALASLEKGICSRRRLLAQQ